ncbi:MAG TPA: exonuclease SbcCD subunit D [Herpetosiphon sp.]|uniref:Nuclease SbcCD subunit D n=1 Tax=Herpetosiphon aurantiacus (strain ATCC 23779 / DSM 785 / 114-95) TaxID=316274 RepID=A9B3V2_HERA2|nr:exonuclease SbcCD subunit D [Herpetosiphon sp.]ABX06088.1 nuclease SbcCD, D subunit [Herpetosiphon aurantiacus DSM 785]HBW48690.1 exonuclease SbcCD subunit D [Herpetosiphon sp.]
MKILHLADIHIGMENYGRIDSTTGLNTRLIDYLDRFAEALQIGIEHDVDLVLIAGDIYKNRTPNPTHQREFARRLRSVLDRGIPVFMLVGNHDVSAAAGKAHSVEIFDTLAIDGVTIADRLGIHTIETRAGSIQIVAVPWISRHAILTKDDIRELPFAELEAELLRRVGAWLEQVPERLRGDLPAILTFHGTVSNATYGAERSVMLGNDLILPPSLLAQPGIQYVALGHIHRYQVLSENPPMIYPGSIERIDFSEESEQKQVVIVEIENNWEDASYQPIAVHPRPFVTIKVDVTGSSDPMERVAQAISKRDLNGAVVRLLISATAEQRPQLDETELRRLLEAAETHVIASIAIEAQRSERTRYAAVASELNEGLTPRRALEIYLESSNISATRREQMLKAADDLIKAEQAREQA